MTIVKQPTRSGPNYNFDIVRAFQKKCQENGTLEDIQKAYAPYEKPSTKRNIAKKELERRLKQDKK